MNRRALDLDVEMQEILARLKDAAPGKTYETVKAVVESYDYLVELVREQGVREERLLELLFCSVGQEDGDRDRNEIAIGNATGLRKQRRRHRRLAGSMKRRVSG